MTKIRDNIFNVGTDGNNSYLITGEKNVLIDTVCESLADELIKNINEILPVGGIDYIVCNHTEPDKAGAVKRLIMINPDIEIIGTIAAMRNLKEITNSGINEHIAKEGAVIEIGKGISLKFCIVPNLNWPDTMVTYEMRNKILFSCDIFSAENGTRKEYYDKYFMPYRTFAKKAMEKISAFDISLICTGRGHIIDSGINEIISDYTKWSEETKNHKTVIVYASRYGATADMADVIKNTLEEESVAAECYDARNCDKNAVMDAVNNADALVFGTPTINRNADKAVWDIVTSLDSITLREKPCMVFGSYGWGGEGTALLYNHLAQVRIRPFEKPYASLFSMSEDKKQELINYTKRFSKIIYN